MIKFRSGRERGIFMVGKCLHKNSERESSRFLHAHRSRIGHVSTQERVTDYRAGRRPLLRTGYSSYITISSYSNIRTSIVSSIVLIYSNIRTILL